MIFEYVPRFKRAYRKLEPADRRRVDEAIRRFAADPAHPSLRVKKLQGMSDIWEVRASDSIRITFQRDGDTLTLRNVGAHDPTLRQP